MDSPSQTSSSWKCEKSFGLVSYNANMPINLMNVWRAMFAKYENLTKQNLESVHMEYKIMYAIWVSCFICE